MKLYELANPRGHWKKEHTKEDQILAMYHALYNIEDLGISKENVAHNVIGTSTDSFVQQALNFEYLHTGKGLDRENTLQIAVYNEFKDTPQNELKRICRDIIQKQLDDPDDHVRNFKLGLKIGNKREDIETQRRRELDKKGFNYDKTTQLNQREKETYDPSEDELIDFLNSIQNKIHSAKKSNDFSVMDSINDDIEFIKEYIESELQVKKFGKSLNEARSTYLLNKKRKYIIISESQLKRLLIK